MCKSVFSTEFRIFKGIVEPEAIILFESWNEHNYHGKVFDSVVTVCLKAFFKLKLKYSKVLMSLKLYTVMEGLTSVPSMGFSIKLKICWNVQCIQPKRLRS